MARIFNKFDVKIAHKPTRTIRNELCNLKDKRSNNDRAGVVYGLDCESCPSIYVGESGRQVKDRMKEHRSSHFEEEACVQNLLPYCRDGTQFRL